MTQMTLLSNNYAERLLSQYTLDIDSATTNNDLTCIICKKLLNDAYQTYCGCQYCRLCIIDYLSEGEKYCCGGKEGCNDEPLVIDENVFKNAMLNRKILKVKVICPNESCTHITEFVQMEEHLRVCTKQSIECPYSLLGCDTENATKDTILTHLNNETLPHTQLLIDLIQNLKNEVDALKDNFEASKLKILSLTEESRVNKLEIEELKKESAEKENRIVALEQESRDKDMQHNCCGTRTDQLETSINDVNNGTMEVTTFTIDRFNTKKATKECIYSPYFYSHLNGYKLRLRVYPGGFASVSGTHLSVYLVICKGEHDDDLMWPCKYSFDISIVNQATEEAHHSQTISYDTIPDNYRHSFHKPVIKDNTGYGYHAFISHTDLSAIEGLIVNDSIIIKCTVSDP